MRRAKRRRRYSTVTDVRIRDNVPAPDRVEGGYAVYLDLDLSKFAELPEVDIMVESRLTPAR